MANEQYFVQFGRMGQIGLQCNEETTKWILKGRNMALIDGIVHWSMLFL